MGRVFRPWYKDRRTGERVIVPSWYAEWTDAGGKTRRKKVGHKRDATEFLAKQEGLAVRQRLGLSPAPTADLVVVGLDSLRGQYLEVLAARGTDAEYRQEVGRHLAAVFAGCGWSVFADVRGDDLVRFLGRRREEKGGPGPATLNGYIRSAKGFARWIAERFDAASPLRKVKPFAEEPDRRRSKRIPSDAELARLIAATEACPYRLRAAFTARDRAMLYRVAAYTGLRASELASLTPASFDLDAAPPLVTVRARDAKGKREEPVPLPAHLVPILRAWLARKRRSARLWPGRWAEVKQQIQWLKRDLKRADISEHDERGRIITFHCLKRRYVMGLIEAGAKPHEVRRLARHRDVRTTLEYYTDAGLADLGKLTDRLR